MNFQQVVEILDQAIGGPVATIGPPHRTFWRGLTRDQFVAKKVLTKPLVVLGDGAASTLVRALKGETPFGEGATFPRMPAGGRPAVPAESIALIEQWINDKCP